MKNNNDLEAFSRTVNDLDDRLPKGRSRCFDIGMGGGCGVNCGAFIDGECEEPQDLSKEEVEEEHGTDAKEIFKLYPCFD